MKNRLIQVYGVLAAILLAATLKFFWHPSVSHQAHEIKSPLGAISLILSQPAQPIDIASSRISELGEMEATTYTKCNVRNCSTFQEWKSHVSEPYALAMGVSESNFNSKRSSPSKMHKEGAITHWVTASNNGQKMLYIIERVNYMPSMPKATAVRFFLWSNGAWVAHSRDELGLVAHLDFTTIETLNSGISRHNHE